MVAARALTRAALVTLIGAGSWVWYACDRGPVAPADSSLLPSQPDLRRAIAVQRLHEAALLDKPGVVGTAVTRLADGRPALQILLERPGISGLPQLLDGIPVTQRVTGRIMAFSDPTQRVRPVPAGYSVGHPSVTAGTIGARVRDALGRVYILSNNHVLANSNNSQLGDAAYQPGPFDGGTAADQIATLSDFQTISFTANGNNTMDAAIALSSSAVLDNATPSDDGYGMPNSTIYGDADGNGLFDDRTALLDLPVQKYGRTTKLTHGQITGVNATVTICYAVSGFTCTKSARFVDQLLIGPAGFSGGGDSGSLIVTDDGNLQPVGLLFAGNASVTVANRIDLVLIRFGVTLDGFAPPPPGPLTDLAVTGVSGPSSVVQGDTATISMTVKNFGNQDVVSAFDVSLRDTTAQVTVGTASVSGLVAGASATVTFRWAPSATGEHTLVARHALPDDQSANDERFLSIPVNAPVTDVAVTNISPSGSLIVGHPVTILVTVQNTGNRSVDGSFVVTLRDTTGGVTIGTQTVPGLGAGALATISFAWNTTDAALGAHTLVASHDLSDDDAANNQRSAVVEILPKPTDIALIGISGPSVWVTQGDTAHILVTVKNVGELDVTSSFDVALTDGTAGGVLVGTQTVAGLAVGAVTTVDIPWNTAGAALNGHILIARQTLPDAAPTNDTYAIAIYIKTPPVTDLAVTGISAPASLTQGGVATIGVSVGNVGGLAVSGSFDLVLTDATAGVTIGTQAVPGLGVGASTMRTFSWNTAGAAIGGHTLVATQSLSDADPANNQRSASVTVNAPVTDLAVTLVSAPSSVTQGSTASVGVTIQNVGGQAVSSSFDVVLTDATSGVTIGTQAVLGLGAGATVTRTFSWTTTNAALGGHTLVATHSLPDINTANNQRSAAVTVTSPPVDLAVTSLTAPASVTQGDTAAVVVTVQNVGGVNVAASFDVVLTDGTAGVTIGTQTIPGLVPGASTTRTFGWSTAGAALNGHILLATQKQTDNNASNNSRAIIVTVSAPSLHVGNLQGTSAPGVDGWSATVVITAHDAKHAPVNGVTVRGNWNGSGPVAECITSEGTCSVVLPSIPIGTAMVSFGVTGMTLTGYVHKPASNHDPDGSSNGYSVFVRRP